MYYDGYFKWYLYNYKDGVTLYEGNDFIKSNSMFDKINTYFLHYCFYTLQQESATRGPYVAVS